jgi:hypothetical protein
MSKLAEFRALEQKLAAQLAELEKLKGDESLKKEIEFEEKLKKLMSSYDKSLKDIIAILDPDAPVPTRSNATTAKPQRKERALKRYKNPETGEVVETKGGNHKVLKAWKEKYGAQTVESWLQ